MDNDAARCARSIFGIDPMDDFVSMIGDCIWNQCRGLTDIEVEAKVGVLLDRRTNERIRLPVFTETVVDTKLLNVRFESDMSMDQHRRFNQLLNQVVAYSAKQAPEERVSYRHQKEIDSFYDERDPQTGQMAHLRVTRDASTKQIKPNGVIAKTRVADINVFCPQRSFDYRISVNVETPMSAPRDSAEATFVREKDRLSYTHQNINVDLTQVILPNKPKEPVHELEVEIRDSAQLMKLASDSRDNNGVPLQEWTPFDDTILILLNNQRLGDGVTP